MGLPHRILSGQRGETARNKYIEYLKEIKGTAQEIGTREPRPEPKAVYIIPFGFDIEDDKQRVIGKVSSSTAFDTYQLKVKPFFDEEWKSAANAPKYTLNIGKFSPAKISITKIKAKGTPETSKRSGLKYLKYTEGKQGNTVSFPFGRKPGATTDADKTEESVYISIYKNLLVDGKVPQGFRFSRIRERS